MNTLDELINHFFPDGYENMTDEEREELWKFPADKNVPPLGEVLCITDKQAAENHRKLEEIFAQQRAECPELAEESE